MPLLLSQLLYCARWFGTLLVLAVHATIQFINFGPANNVDPSLPVRTWRFLAGFEFGRHAVIGFFVMSGFLVGGAVVTHLRQDRPFLLEYSIHRVARIYLVLLPALVVTIVCDSLGRQIFAGSGVYEFPFLQEHYDPILIVTDILNLQGIIARYYGTNGPLWSIAYEFWYYILFPALLLPFARVYTPRRRSTVAALTLLLVIVVSIKQGWFALGFLLWGMGAAAILPTQPLIRSARMSLVINIVVVIAMRLFVAGERLEHTPSLLHFSDVVSAAAFANLILTLRFCGGEMWPLLRSNLHRRLADFSFSVYAIHMPLLVFMRAGISRVLGDQWLEEPAALAQWTALAIVMSITLTIGYFFSLATEAHTSAARRMLRRFVRGLEIQPIAPAKRSLEAASEENTGVTAKYTPSTVRLRASPPVSVRERVKGRR